MPRENNNLIQYRWDNNVLKLVDIVICWGLIGWYSNVQRFDNTRTDTQTKAVELLLQQEKASDNCIMQKGVFDDV